MPELDQYNTRIGRIKKPFSCFKFRGKKGWIIVTYHILQEWMLSIGYLNHNPAISGFSSCPSTSLLHELECPFMHSEISKMHQAVRIKNSYQVYIFKIQAFHHHLGPHQDIYALLFEKLYHVFMSILSAYTVNIHTGYPRLGKDFFQMLFNPFRAKIPLCEFVIPTGSTGAYRRINSA